MFINLNTTSKEDFVSDLICCDEVNDFYLPREPKLLSLDFDLDEMKKEFEEWLQSVCE